MASTVRSKQLFAGQVSASGITYVYTVPALTTTIFKSVFVRNAGSGSCQFAVGGEFPPGSGNRVDVLQDYVVPLISGGSDGLEGMWVMNPGDGIAVNLQSGGPIDVWCSGVELV